MSCEQPGTQRSTHFSELYYRAAPRSSLLIRRTTFQVGSVCPIACVHASKERGPIGRGQTYKRENVQICAPMTQVSFQNSGFFNPYGGNIHAKVDHMADIATQSCDLLPRPLGDFGPVSTARRLSKHFYGKPGRHFMEEITLEDHRLRSAFALAKEMLPSEERIDKIQAHYPLDVSSYYRARDGIGGDIWGIEAVGPQRVMIYVADFSDHGIAAALNAARFHSFVRVDHHRMAKPSSLLRRLNERLHEVLPVDKFATMFCATIDFKTQTMEYASAGAPPPLYRESTGWSV